MSAAASRAVTPVPWKMVSRALLSSTRKLPPPCSFMAAELFVPLSALQYFCFSQCVRGKEEPLTLSWRGFSAGSQSPSPPGCTQAAGRGALTLSEVLSPCQRCSHLVFLTSIISSPNPCLDSRRRHTDLSLVAGRARLDKCIWIIRCGALNPSCCSTKHR